MRSVNFWTNQLLQSMDEPVYRNENASYGYGLISIYIIPCKSVKFGNVERKIYKSAYRGICHLLYRIKRVRKPLLYFPSHTGIKPGGMTTDSAEALWDLYG